MNVSDKYKLLWFAVPRAASRTLSQFLWSQFEFINLYDLSVNVYTHEIVYDHDKYSDYDIIMCIRNPYSKMISSWKIENEDHKALGYETFEKYVKNACNWTHQDKTAINVCKSYNRNIKYLIEFDNLSEDIKKLPFDKIKTDYSFKLNLKNIGYMNPYMSNSLKRNDKKMLSLNYYYNDELADIVYNNDREIFEFFGYKQDSWKYL